MATKPSAKTPAPFGRTMIEIAIVIGMVGIGGMVAWQAFGHVVEKGIASNHADEGITVEADCVGGLCVQVELAQVEPGHKAVAR
jgi:hypothetical protein